MRGNLTSGGGLMLGGLTAMLFTRHSADAHVHPTIHPQVR
jgi:hypothetical protein